MMNTLFPPGKDSLVADLLTNPGFDTKPLIARFGPEVTWRQVFLTSDQDLMLLPGYGPETVRKIRVYINTNIEFTFNDFLAG